uniref:Uncharacterized protein n=1 Tax=Nelumbo nucifera TaxID=4432 RepID=A0A822XZ40_NELNU|nr:TPA_asm: hypothetical protein HUJ06_025945 [Nelumbo nucifera]
MQLRKSMGTPEVPPGYDPVLDAKPKTKAAKRNERKKEKKHQAALEKEKSLALKVEMEKTGEVPSAEDVNHRSETVESVAHQMDMLSVSGNLPAVAPSANSVETSNPGAPGPDLDRRIRALKKKVIFPRLIQN